MLVFISTWGQEITCLNFPVWQKWAEFGEGGADGSTEPHCSASTCLKDDFCPTLCGKCCWKSWQDPWGSELRGLVQSTENIHQVYFPGALKMRSGRATRSHADVFSEFWCILSGKCGRGRGIFSKTTRSLLFYQTLILKKERDCLQRFPLVIRVCNPSSCFSGHSTGDMQ